MEVGNRATSGFEVEATSIVFVDRDLAASDDLGGVVVSGHGWKACCIAEGDFATGCIGSDRHRKVVGDAPTDIHRKVFSCSGLQRYDVSQGQLVGFHEVKHVLDPHIGIVISTDLVSSDHELVLAQHLFEQTETQLGLGVLVVVNSHVALVRRRWIVDFTGIHSQRDSTVGIGDQCNLPVIQVVGLGPRLDRSEFVGSLHGEGVWHGELHGVSRVQDLAGKKTNVRILNETVGWSLIHQDVHGAG